MKVWSGSEPKCDAGNGHNLNGEFYDAAIPAYRQWAILCPACAKRHGVKLGLGFGQRYQKQSNGAWLKVEG